MTYRDLLGLLLPRAKTLGIVDAESGQVDAAEAELALVNAIMMLSDGWDLDCYTVINDNLFMTTAGQRQYRLPSDFGRFPRPKQRDDASLYLYDASQEFGLSYMDPAAFFAMRSTTNGTPSTFTVTDNRVMLDPPPDTNSGNQYIGRGIYIKRITSIEWRDDILVPLPTTLLDGALAQLAILHSSPRAPDLFTIARASAEKLLNHQARMRTQFQPFTSGQRRPIRRAG